MRKARAAAAGLLAALSLPLHAQQCPKVDPQEQKAREAECRAANGQWSRFGVKDHLCNVYSCAPRTSDGGKACRNRSDCEYLCITEGQPRVGSEVAGHCAVYRTSFGCTTHVDQGKVVGRVCID